MRLAKLILNNDKFQISRITETEIKKIIKLTAILLLWFLLLVFEFMGFDGRYQSPTLYVQISSYKKKHPFCISIFRIDVLTESIKIWTNLIKTFWHQVADCRNRFVELLKQKNESSTLETQPFKLQISLFQFQKWKREKFCRLIFHKNCLLFYSINFTQFLNILFSNFIVFFHTMQIFIAKLIACIKLYRQTRERRKPPYIWKK